jgi:hypothetical protein
MTGNKKWFFSLTSLS